MRALSPRKTPESLTFDDYVLLEEAARPASTLNPWDPSYGRPGLMEVVARGDVDKLLAVLARVPGDVDVSTQRARRRAVMALQKAGLLTPAPHGSITFRCDLCHGYDDLRRTRKRLVVPVPWGSRQRLFLVCSTCSKRQHPPARCSYQGLGPRCTKAARVRSAFCDEHRAATSFDDLVRLRDRLDQESIRWRSAGLVDAPDALRAATSAARSYLDAAEELGVAVDEARQKLDHPGPARLPVTFRARVAELERIAQRGGLSRSLRLRYALHGLARDPVLAAIPFADEAGEGPDRPVSPLVGSRRAPVARQ